MLYPLFEWLESLRVYGASIYVGPGVNLLHLLSMVTFLGALLLVDLRLLGAGLRRRPLSEVAAGARPWLVAGLVGLAVTGLPQLADSATTQYASSTFWVKMYLLAFGLIWTFTVRRRVAERAEAYGALPKVVAVVSIVVWLSVAATARLIMLLPDDFWFDVDGVPEVSLYQ